MLTNKVDITELEFYNTERRIVLLEICRKPKEILEEDFAFRHMRFHKNGNLKHMISYSKSGDFIGESYHDDNGLPHRDNDMPSVIYRSGEQRYTIHGTLHRGIFKPAVTRPDGYKEYWVHGDLRSKVDKGEEKLLDKQTLVYRSLRLYN